MPRKSDKPIFSIIIPCYNHAHFLKDSIESVRSQNFSDWELIVINDGSTDHTQELAEGLAEIDGRIIIINQPNKGLSAARNLGLSQAEGKVVSFLDADDWLLPNCLQKIHEIFKKNHIDLLVSSYTYFKNNTPIHNHVFEKSLLPNEKLMVCNIAPPVAFFVSTKILNKIGAFDIQLKSCEDWDLWIRAAKMGAKIYSISEILVAYRYVPYSMSRNPRVMYQSLSEVSRRAGNKDSRIAGNANFNKDFELDYPNIQKRHLIGMLGVMLHQEKLQEAVEWYQEEQKIWNWTLNLNDWKRLSSNLSWAYFFESEEIKTLLKDTYPLLKKFFLELGYSKKESVKLSRMIFAPQLKKKNHIRFGSVLGAGMNKFGWY